MSDEEARGRYAREIYKAHWEISQNAVRLLGEYGKWLIA
jgi:hypothetical protein